MKLCWYRCLAVCLFLVTVAARAQRSEEWLPITKQDLQIRDVPGDPGASALQLYYADFRDDVRESEFIYKRIKILNEKGKEYANVEIEIPLRKLYARAQQTRNLSYERESREQALRANENVMDVFTRDCGFRNEIKYTREYKMTTRLVPLDRIEQLKRLFSEINADEKNMAVLKRAT